MSAERHARVKELLLGAADLPLAARAAYLDAECGGDAALREEVEELLDLDGRTGDDLLRLPFAARITPPSEAGPGDRLSGERAYRLLEPLGDGGMGRVFLAERVGGDFRQVVAIKLLAWYLGGDAEAERRFRRERQILARLDHPNIARLVDGGTTSEGKPFLVLEHVDGVPIDAHVEREKLDVPTTLGLFLRVCDAVRFAHQSLVVHRDLKPANILVVSAAGGGGGRVHGPSPDAGEPKLLDFGIAKLLSDDTGSPPGDGAATRRGDLVLTPRYASPEQVRGEAITTATDIYSLGVVLYELIAGRPPYEVPTTAPAELLRAVCETQPLPPSTHASSRLGRAAGDAAPGGRIPRDLDAIVLKALRKEPEARYGSVEAFADDLRRHLDGRPVLARNGGAAYRFARFVRRNRWSLVAAGLFAGTVAAFVLQLARQLDETELQRDLARRERDRASATSDFLVGLFAGADPSEARGREITARDLVDRGAERLQAELAGQPELQATLLDSLGRVYRHLGEPQKGVPLLEKALALRRARGGPPDETLYLALQHLGLARLEASRLDEAELLLREALEVRASARIADEVDGANTESSLAMVHTQRAEFAEAAALMEKVVAAKERRFGKRSAEVAISKLNLASMHFRRGDLGEAEALSLEAVEILKGIYRGDHPDVAFALSNLAASIDDNRRALPILEESLAMRRRLLGDRHPDVGLSINNLAATLYWMGEVERAVPLLREALGIWLESHGEEAAVTASVRHNLGQALLDGGSPAAARPYLVRALEVREGRSRADDPDAALTRTALGQVLCELGEVSRGEELVRTGIEVQSRVLAADSLWRVNVSGLRLARCLALRGDTAAAAATFQENAAPLRARLGSGHPLLQPGLRGSG
jgi:serine/threonine protein kinase